MIDYSNQYAHPLLCHLYRREGNEDKSSRIYLLAINKFGRILFYI